MKRIAIAITAIASSLVVESCRPAIRRSDAGDYSFARQVVPKLLGRKVKGHTEIKLLADISAAAGRGVTARALMNLPEFDAHWAEQITDQIRVNRIEGKAQTGCFGAPQRPNSSRDLATWIRDHAARDRYPDGSFNMSDVLLSSLALDDLSAAYRAYLFPMVNKPLEGNEITAATKQDDLAVTFTNAYTHRQMLCLSCHSEAGSASGAASGWNRTHPIPGGFEASMYANPNVIVNPRVANVMFRTDIAGGEVQPWNMSPDCGTFRPDPPSDASPHGYFINDLGARGSIWDVERRLSAGYRLLSERGLARSGPENTVDGDAAFAYLVGANIVNQTWAEVMGTPLTIPNYFPRNTNQRDLLWELTEVHFLQNHWSLRLLLEQILTSDYFNRKSPQTTEGTTAYETPLYNDPWTEADPRVPPVSEDGYVRAAHPENHKNSMGEGVHRYSARSLLHSLHAALDWPAPARFPDSSYPSLEFAASIGQFTKDAQPGFRGVDFQGLLSWEGTTGTCSKPVPGTIDWIDRLVGQVRGFDPATGPLPTYSDVAIAIKDWLTGDSRLYDTRPEGQSQTEPQAIAALFGVRRLSDAAGADPDLEDKARRYCGAVLQSPQFLLAGIAPESLGPAPRLRVCNSGPCTYQQMCTAMQPAVNEALGPLTRMACEGNSVRVVSEPYRFTELCPAGACGWIVREPSRRFEPVRPGDPSVARFPSIQPPACDPRRGRASSCVTSSVPRPSPDRGYFLAWADKATVRTSSGVRIRTPGGKEFEQLASGRVLAFGDVLEIPQGATLDLRSARGRLRTPRWSSSQTAQANPYYMVITGEQAIAIRQPPLPAQRPMTAAEFLKRHQSGEGRFGEAGPPVPEDQRRPADEAHKVRGLKQQMR